MSKTLKSIKYTTIAAVVKRLLSFVLLWFITANISKSQVGDFQLFSSIIAIPILIVFCSLDYLFIVKQKNTQKYKKAMFNTGFLLSIVFAVLIAVFSKHIGVIYKNPNLAIYLKNFFWILPLEAIRRALRFNLQKQMKFKKLSIYEVYNSVFYTSLMVLAVSISNSYKNAYMLILTFYAGNILELILLLKKSKITSFLTLNIKNSFNVIKQNRFFCAFTTTTHTAGYFSDSIPVLFLGSIFSSNLLGLYFLAIKILSAPVNLLSASLSQVFFSSLSKQKDFEISKNIKRYIFVVLTLVIPLLGLFVVFSYKFLPLILPNTAKQWLDVLPLLCILIIPMISTILVNPLSPILMIKNKTNYELYWNIFSLIFKLLATYLGSFYSFNFALLCFALSTFISHITLLAILSKTVGCSLKSVFVKNILNISLLIFLSFGMFYFIKLNTVICVILSLLSFLLFGIIANIFSKNKLFNEIKNLKG